MAQSVATSGPYVARSFEDLAQGMIDYFVAMGTQVTDMTQGSTVRTILEALAVMGEQVYADLAVKLQDAIAQSAFINFSFTPLPPTQAVGNLIVQTTPAAQTAGTAGLNITNAGGTAPGATSFTLSQAGLAVAATGWQMTILDGALTETVTVTGYASPTVTTSPTLFPHGQNTQVQLYSGQNGLAAPVTLQRGTQWQPQGQDLTYLTQAGVTVPAGVAGRWHIPAQCGSPGIVGNLAAAITGSLVNPVSGLAAMSEDGTVGVGDFLVAGNPTPAPQAAASHLPLGFYNGTNPETPLQMRIRFTSFLDSLHRSTLAALEYGAKTATLTDSAGNVIEQVILARAIDYTLDQTFPTAARVGLAGPGSANVYVYNGVGGAGGLATGAQGGYYGAKTGTLIASAQSVIDGSINNSVYIPGYKAAGIPTTVIAADEYDVSFSVTATAQGSGTATAFPSALIVAGIQQAVAAYFAGLNIGDPLNINTLVTAMGAVQGVANIAVTALSITRRSSGLVVWSSVADFSYTSSPAMTAYGILALVAGQPTITVA